MVTHCDIVVRGSRVIFDCDSNFIGQEPEQLRETLEAKIDIEAVPDGKRIGTATFPTADEGNTSFSLHDEYKQQLY